MNKLIKVLYKPDKSNDGMGIYKLLFEISPNQENRKDTYEVLVYEYEYKVIMLRQKLIFELGYSEKYIEEFEQAVRDMVYEESR